MPLYHQGKKVKNAWYGGRKVKNAWYGGQKVFASTIVVSGSARDVKSPGIFQPGTFSTVTQLRVPDDTEFLTAQAEITLLPGDSNNMTLRLAGSRSGVIAKANDGLRNRLRLAWSGTVVPGETLTLGLRATGSDKNTISWRFEFS